jgi:IclR family transcriptional regulator, KDG regulon repressor
MVNSVRRAAAILDLLGREKRLGLSQVAKSLRIPKSTAHSIIETLVREGLVARDGPTGTFSLGIRLLELGQAAQENFELRRVASPRLLSLNREVDETVHLTVLDGDVVLYVECFESSKRLRTYSVIGVRAPLHCTAVGKAILAFLDDDEQIRLVNRIPLERFTERTITDRATLLAHLRTVRTRGWSIDDVEHEEGVRCVGVPVFDNRACVCASISISGPTQRIRTNLLPSFARKARAAALDVSRSLGYRGT